MLASVPRSGGNSIRDRTQEFKAIVERLQKEQGVLLGSSVPTGNGSVPSSSSLATHSEFAKRASKIGMGIHSTSQKLQKLAQLAKKTSIFDDPAEEINEISTVIKQDIQALNQGISDLQTFSGGGSNKQSSDHSHTVIDNLRTRLKDATKEFKDVLTLRTDNLKVHQERKSLFSSAPEAKSPLFGTPGASFLPENAKRPFAAQIHGGLQLPESETVPLLQSQQVMIPAQDQYLNSRADALHQVESTIVELGSIFQQLAHMVHEQGEMAARIDENVDETLTNVEAGQEQLLKYLNTISSNRWLIMKVFFVLMMFLTFFIVFIA